MKHTTIKKFLPFIICILLVSFKAKAWGPEGHAIIAKIAMQFLKPDVRQNVLNALDGMSLETAANWMDIMKSNADYEFMRSWHYIDFPKEQPYQPSNDETIISKLYQTFNELKHRKTLCEEQAKFDLLVLLHLMGDLHMPLHTAYDRDLGGNRQIVQLDTMKTHNLHLFWDEDIIRLQKIKIEDCLQQLKALPKSTVDTSTVDFVRWMQDSRSLLDQVYDYPEYHLYEQYLTKSTTVVKQQLLVAGLRLAYTLNKVFYSPAPLMNVQEVTSKHRNGIDANDAMKYLGKKVTVCSRVYGVKYGEKITRINLGDRFPKSPLTVIIFAKSYSNFQGSIEDMFKDKNVCVKGKVEQYQGKAQIVVEDPKELLIQ
jgi:hypothetical protein